MELNRILITSLETLTNLEKAKRETPKSKRGEDWASWATATEINAKRMIEIVEIAERMTEEEKAQIRATPVYKDDVRFLKPIKEKYTLSWSEIKMLIASDI